MLKASYWNAQSSSFWWVGLEQVWSFFKVTLRKATLTADAASPVRPEDRAREAAHYAWVYNSEASRFPCGQVFISEDQQRLIYAPIEVDDCSKDEAKIELRAKELSKALYINAPLDQIEKLVTTKKSYSTPKKVSKSLRGIAILQNLLGDKISKNDMKWIAVCRLGEQANKAFSHITLG